MKKLSVILALCAALFQGCAENPRIREAETLFVGAKQREAQGGASGRSEALSTYQMIARDYSDTPYGKRAQAECDRLAPTVSREASERLTSAIEAASR
jgi:hypothetical protein